VLVHADRVEAAVRALAGLGYRPSSAATRSTIHVALENSRGGRPWRSTGGSTGTGTASRPACCTRRWRTGTACAAAPPAATLVALLVFYTRDGFAGLRLPVDIAAYADAMGDRLRAADVLADVSDDPDIGTAMHAALLLTRRTVASTST
jgi:hypothetical protein